MKRRVRAGFTLLEVLVAATVMAVAVAAALSALSTSTRNASRVTEADRAALLAKRTMDHLLVDPDVPVGQMMEGRFREATFNGGWRALIERHLTFQNALPEEGSLGRVLVEVWWMSGAQRRTFRLEGYRRLRR